MIFDALIQSSELSIKSSEELICSLEVQLEKARLELADKQLKIQDELTAQTSGQTALDILRDAMQKVFAVFGQTGIDDMCEEVLNIATATLKPNDQPLMLTAATEPETDPITEPEPPTGPAQAITETIATPVDEVTDVATFSSPSHVIITGNSTAPTSNDQPVTSEILPRPTEEQLSGMSTHQMYRCCEAYGIWSRRTNTMRYLIKKYLMGNFYLNLSTVLELPNINDVSEMPRKEVLKYARQCDFPVRNVSLMRSDLISEIRAQEAYKASFR